MPNYAAMNAYKVRELNLHAFSNTARWVVTFARGILHVAVAQDGVWFLGSFHMWRWTETFKSYRRKLNPVPPSQ